MKSITLLYSLFIVLSFVDTVVSYSSGQAHLYDVIRKSLNTKNDVRLSDAHVFQHTRSNSIAPVHQQSSSVQEEDDYAVELKREVLDSGEDQYFRWALLNRRPMESLVGRKRSAELVVPAPRPTRIGGGIWHSGLVG